MDDRRRTAMNITTIAELETLYAAPASASLSKVADHLTPEYARLLEASPFVALATVGPDGADCSPRGDRGQVAFALDDRTVAIPDRRGNNRIDTLRNIVADPRVGCLFLIPGCNECLRINGRARLSRDPALIERFTVDGKPPVTVIVVEIEAVYFQCARALIRSNLWNVHIDRATLPKAGELIRSADASFEAEPYDAGLAERQATTLY